MKNFMGKEEFPWLDELEIHTYLIRKEYLRLKPEDFTPYPDSENTNGRSFMHMIFDGVYGFKVDNKTPYTAEVIKNVVPNYGSAAFSVLKPGGKIYQHRGFSGALIRLHLPLIVPPGDVAFQVRDEARKFVEGHTWAFNDRLQHQSWNNTDFNRVILIVEFRRSPKSNERASSPHS